MIKPLQALVPRGANIHPTVDVRESYLSAVIQSKFCLGKSIMISVATRGDQLFYSIYVFTQQLTLIYITVILYFKLHNSTDID